MSEAADLREFIRDMNTRSEKRNDAMIRRLDAGTAQLRELTVDIRESREDLRDMRAQIRANTEAVLRVLDELRGSS